jgi:hypothetical protein
MFIKRLPHEIPACFAWPIYMIRTVDQAVYDTVYTFYCEIIIFTLLLVSLKLIGPSSHSISLDLDHFFTYFKSFTFLQNTIC